MNKSEQAVAIFNKHVRGYEQKYMDVSLYVETLNFLCDNIRTKNANVLELACGPGNLTKYLLSRKNDLKILATDLAPNMLVRAKSNNPTIETALLDAREIKTLPIKFDLIVCGFLFPYLSKTEAVKLIQDSASIINANGLIYISTMEDDYSKSGFEKGSSGEEIYMHYHQCDYLSEALLINGFTMLKTDRIESIMTNGQKVIDLILIAQLNNKC